MPKGFSTPADILKSFKEGEDKQGLSLRDKYISREFQKYGYDLAAELGDLKNKSLYIKLAKETPRWLMEAARNFVKDAANVKNPTALFLWKLTELKKEAKNKKK